MNTPNLTEAEVIAWLRSRAESYGIKGLSLDITGNAASSACTARVPKAGSTWGVHYSFAPTIDEAVAKVRAEIKSPEEVAAKLRADAAKLIAEADAILAPPAPAETAEKVEVAA